MLDRLNEIRLYSIAEAAKAMRIGKDNLNRLIEEGKLGFIRFGKSKKISHYNILQFIKTNTEYGTTRDNLLTNSSGFLQNNISDLKNYEGLGGHELIENFLEGD
jgi:excisionase family DNA binding protein